MGNYLEDIKEKAYYKEIETLIPSGLCPFLLYNLGPYIFTLAKGGWFDWVRRNKDSSFRKSASKEDFGRKNVNRVYGNEVLVRCPNPHTMVVAGVGLWPEDRIKVRILHSSNMCPNNHRRGDEVVMAMSDEEVRAVSLNKHFPEILRLCLVGHASKEGSHFYEIDGGITLEVFNIVHPCRYHRNKDTVVSNLLPTGFCPHVFNEVYPFLLAKLYGGDIEEEISLTHPGSKDDVRVDLRKVWIVRSTLARESIKLAKKLFETVFHPVDLLDCYVKVNFLENMSEGCSSQKGKEYVVDLRNKNHLCPASFHTLYPYLCLAALGYEMKWGQDDGNRLVPCPDCVGAVYSLREGSLH